MLVPMKKATLYGLLAEREDILAALQTSGQFMAIETGDADAPLEQSVAQTDAAIKFLTQYAGKQPMFAPRDALTPEELFEGDEEAVAARREIAELTDELGALRSKAASLKGQAETMTPWSGLAIPLEEIKDTKYAMVFTGIAQERNFSQLIEALEEAGAEVQQLGTSSEGRALFIVCHKANEEAVREAFKMGFAEMALPKLPVTASQARQDYLEEAERALKEAEGLEGRAAQLSGNLKRLRALYDSLSAERDRQKVQSADSTAAFTMQGWVREDMTSLVEKALDGVTDAWAIEFTDPEEGDDPPVYTLNNKVVTPFEAVTDLYSRPAYGSYDPNPIMSVFYFLFFGMMVGDAGYGILMTIAVLLFQKFYRPRGNFAKLVGVILFGSISTFLWGVMFGGYFGIELFKPILFSPLTDPMPMLILCYGLGIVHLFVGMGVKMVLDFKKGDWQAAVFDTISWYCLYIGIGLLFLQQTRTAGMVVALLGVAMILFMTKRDEKNILKRITGGLGALYGISGFLTDVLSYSRLFAMGLATGVIAMVFNTIGEMLLGIPVAGIIFFAAFMAFGHLFNIALNSLGAFVHAARLQYIEFFGKFYEFGGREFRPLAFRPRYVDVVKNKE